MAIRKIISIGVNVPHDDVEEVSFYSDRSLLDADIVLFSPFAPDHAYTKYLGKPSLDESDSFTFKEAVLHWNRELKEAYLAGKSVFVYLAKPAEVYVQTGRKETSGTGRNQKVTNFVDLISSYDALPTSVNPTPRRGTQITPFKELAPLTQYWEEFKEFSQYHTTISGKFSSVMLVADKANTPVGARMTNGSGYFIFLPVIDLTGDGMVMQTGRYTAKAMRVGQRYVQLLVDSVDALTTGVIKTPTPEWALSEDYVLPEEGNIKQEISTVENKIDGLIAKRGQLQQDLDESTELRGLLFENGKQLGKVVISAVRLMGYEVDQFDDGQSEFDAVIVSGKERYIGEVEGRDRRSVNIDKFSQLERNIQEDFARDEIDEYAKGILFGNGHRLVSPDSRGDCFSAKCMTAAERSGTILIRSADLFEPARYLNGTSDPEYAKACRKAISQAIGSIVVFPHPPTE